MDWVQDMTARWAQIMRTAGEGRTPLDEAVGQISAIGGTPAKEGRSGGLKQNRRARADAPPVTVLARLLVAGVLVSDQMIGQLAAVAGQTREQVLDQMVSGAAGQQLRDQQLSALRAELSGSCAALQDHSRGSYVTLGTRIERLLRLAEEQASAIVDAARAEAAEITSTASKQPCPRCGEN